MYKTVVNFRNDFGENSIDSKFTCEWNSRYVNALKLLKELNPALDIKAEYRAMDGYEGMMRFALAHHGMKIRKAMDSAIDGPYVLDHEEPELDDAFLIDWWLAKRK